METQAIKRFRMKERTLEGGYYIIEVFDGRNNLIDRFSEPTQKETLQRFAAAGYEQVLG